MYIKNKVINKIMKNLKINHISRNLDNSLMFWVRSLNENIRL